MSLLKTEGLVEAFGKLKIKPDDEVSKTCALGVIAISKRLDKLDEAMVLMAKHLTPLSEEHSKLKKGFQQLVDELLKEDPSAGASAAAAGDGGAAAAPAGPQQPFPAGFSPNAPAPGATAAAAQGDVEEEEEGEVDLRNVKPDVVGVVTHMAPNAPAGKVPTQPVPAPPSVPPVVPPVPNGAGAK